VKDIKFYNRYTGQTETEQVYGEAFLKWAYGNPLGKIALHSLVKRPVFSKWYGSRMSQPVSHNRVTPFINDYELDVSEFADSPESYATFNEFFFRKLKPEARPIGNDPVVFPADGRHLGFENTDLIQGVFVKGQKFDVDQLLANPDLSKKYQGGSLVLSRLCPVDYHRFHFPVSGTPSQTRLINGPLFSVSPIALGRNLSYLWQNKRTVTEIQTKTLGTVLMLEIGATCVGSIQQTYQPDTAIEKGAEKGYFAFGGSSTITLFEPGKVQLAADLLENSAQQMETYARMGDNMGTLKTQ
jgi:phosphatidylserine decarboxylase